MEQPHRHVIRATVRFVGVVVNSAGDANNLYGKSLGNRKAGRGIAFPIVIAGF